ncbi:MAG TPA: hypothetical protein VGF88_09015 [Acidobacteriaceae bacterium]|jgi:hypothetical protein
MIRLRTNVPRLCPNPQATWRFLCAALTSLVFGATHSGWPQAPLAPPLPDIPTLIAQVRDHQRQMESVQENYTFHETDFTEELNKSGSVKKRESEEYEIFYVNTHEVRRLLKKDGKEPDASQEKKEQERLTKYVQKAQQTPPGQAPNGEVVISVGRILAMAKVSAPRREILDGRSTIAFDFVGDPHAKAHNIAEEAARRTSGTFWIDEQDRQVRRLMARLTDNVHGGFGLFSLNKGSNLTFDQKLVNNELWLPTGASISLIAHAVGIIGFRANIQVTDNDYRKFHADAQQQPGATVTPMHH